MRSNAWEIEEARTALVNGKFALCQRYLEKALECVTCAYCHGSLDDGRSAHPYFKGYIHEECLAARRNA